MAQFQIFDLLCQLALNPNQPACVSKVVKNILEYWKNLTKSRLTSFSSALGKTLAIYHNYYTLKERYLKVRQHRSMGDGGLSFIAL